MPKAKKWTVLCKEFDITLANKEFSSQLIPGNAQWIRYSTAEAISDQISRVSGPIVEKSLHPFQQPPPVDPYHGVGGPFYIIPCYLVAVLLGRLHKFFQFQIDPVHTQL